MRAARISHVRSACEVGIGCARATNVYLVITGPSVRRGVCFIALVVLPPRRAIQGQSCYRIPATGIRPARARPRRTRRAAESSPALAATTRARAGAEITSQPWVASPRAASFPPASLILSSTRTSASTTTRRRRSSTSSTRPPRRPSRPRPPSRSPREAPLAPAVAGRPLCTYNLLSPERNAYCTLSPSPHPHRETSRLITSYPPEHILASAGYK